MTNNSQTQRDDKRTRQKKERNIKAHGSRAAIERIKHKPISVENSREPQSLRIQCEHFMVKELRYKQQYGQNDSTNDAPSHILRRYIFIKNR